MAFKSAENKVTEAEVAAFIMSVVCDDESVNTKRTVVFEKQTRECSVALEAVTQYGFMDMKMYDSAISFTLTPKGIARAVTLSYHGDKASFYEPEMFDEYEQTVGIIESAEFGFSADEERFGLKLTLAKVDGSRKFDDFIGWNPYADVVAFGVDDFSNASESAQQSFFFKSTNTTILVRDLLAKAGVKLVSELAGSKVSLVFGSGKREYRRWEILVKFKPEFLCRHQLLDRGSALEKAPVKFINYAHSTDCAAIGYYRNIGYFIMVDDEVVVSERGYWAPSNRLPSETPVPAELLPPTPAAPTEPTLT